ncbi:hypothetical protein JCM4914_11690 [Streptomyces platensis subsp. malvinus]
MSGVRAGRGDAYGSPYPGSIRAVPTPQLPLLASPLEESLPYASSLCGACYEVCPVAIGIPEVLVHLRERVVEGGPAVRGGARVVLKPAKGHAAERAAMRTAMRTASWAFGHPGVLRRGMRLAARTRGVASAAVAGAGACVVAGP